MHPILLPLLLISLLVVSCGDDPASDDDTNNSTGYWLDDVDCPRLETETFDDCTYEENLRLFGTDSDPYFTNQLEQFCQSNCNKAQGIDVDSNVITDLAPLVGLESIRALSIESDSIETLDGLQDLRRIEGTHEGGVQIMYSGELRSLDALSSLEYVEGPIRLQDVDGLTNLGGLESVETAYLLDINDLKNLESIDALESLDSLEFLMVKDNPELPTCQAEQLAERLELADEDVTIENNSFDDCPQ